VQATGIPRPVNLKVKHPGTDFGRNPFEKGFLPSHLPKTFKSFGKQGAPVAGVQGKTLFQKGFPLKPDCKLLPASNLFPYLPQ
jgi:hypothetical protein